MSGESRNRASFDPTKLWRQWYEAGTKMWSEVLGGARGNYVDPYGLYRQWFRGVEELQKRMLAPGGASPTAAGAFNLTSLVNPDAAQNPAAAANPAVDAAKGQAVEVQNLWRDWLDTMSASWQKVAALGNEAVELTPRWVAMLDQMRHNFLVAEGVPTDPLQFATRWYNATSGPLTDFVGDLIEREEFLDVSSDLMRSYASFYKVFRRDSEEYLKALSIPVRSDVARVAGLVVGLEDKIDRLEEAFEDFEYTQAEPATEGSLEAVEERIEGGDADDATGDSVSRLESRIDEVEAKIDRLLVALENNTSQNGGQAAPQAETSPAEEEGQEEGEEEESSPQSDVDIRATAAARRKAQELGVDLAQVEGTGANGQVTVNDVRRTNARQEGES